MFVLFVAPGVIFVAVALAAFNEILFGPTPARVNIEQPVSGD